MTDVYRLVTDSLAEYKKRLMSVVNVTHLECSPMDNGTMAMLPLVVSDGNASASVTIRIYELIFQGYTELVATFSTKISGEAVILSKSLNPDRLVETLLASTFEALFMHIGAVRVISRLESSLQQNPDLIINPIDESSYFSVGSPMATVLEDNRIKTIRKMHLFLYTLPKSYCVTYEPFELTQTFMPTATQRSSRKTYRRIDW